LQGNISELLAPGIIRSAEASTVSAKHNDDLHCTLHSLLASKKLETSQQNDYGAREGTAELDYVRAEDLVFATASLAAGGEIHDANEDAYRNGSPGLRKSSEQVSNREIDSQK
jgi:hypothetical protein